MEALVLVFLIMLNGVFAMAEIAIVTARRGRLQAMAEQGDPGAGVALKLAEEPTQFLSTVQIGITSIGILNGIVGESVLAEPFAHWLQNIGLAAATAAPLATTLVVVVVTYLSIVVGELVPKRIGQISAENVARIIALPMSLLALIAIPVVKLLTLSTQLLLRVLGFWQSDENKVTEDDIHAMLREGSESGVIEMHERSMVKSVFRFDERTASSLMIPRPEVEYLDAGQPWEKNYRKMMAAPHTRFPLCDGGMDNLIGIVTAKDILSHMGPSAPVDLQAVVKPTSVIYPGTNAMELLRRFRREDLSMAFIVDEYGVFKGLITLQDLLEALTGDFYAESEEHAWIVERRDGSYLLDGLLPILDVEDVLGLPPQTKDRGFETLSGLIMAHLDQLPSAGATISLDGWQLEIVDMDGRRIDKVLATKLEGGGPGDTTT